MNNHLRIGFLISNTKEILEWEAAMITELEVMPGVTIVAFISAEPTTQKRKGFGLRAFEAFENRWFGSARDAFRKKPITEGNKVPGINIEDKDALSKLDLDIIYCTHGVTNLTDVETFAKYGVWYHSFGADDKASAAPIGFWEVMKDLPEIESTLYIKGLKSQPVAIYEGTTIAVPYSVKNTRNNIGWKSSSYIIFRLDELIRSGPESFFAKYKESPVRDKTIVAKKNSTPGTLKMTGLFVRNVFRYLRYKISLLWSRKKFTILFSKQPFNLSEIDLSKFKSLQLPANVFWADPFIMEKENKTYVFFEEFDYKKKKAHISMIEIGENGQAGKSTIVLDKPYHLSYPFIFEYGNELYMIPETGEDNSVQLYKCHKFPAEWEFDSYLMKNGLLIDPTLLFHQDKWWLFGTRPEPAFTSTNDQLFLYSSESLLSGEWIPHPQNPVATNISNCRPAGKIFSMNGKLYRPAQNNASKRYGYAIKINEIEILNEKEYKEKEVFEIIPDGKRLSGIHTINFTANYIAIDGIL